MVKYKGYIFGLLSGLLWGVTGILYEVLNKDYPFVASLVIILSLLFLIESGSLLLAGLLCYKKVPQHRKLITHKQVSILAVIAGLIGGPIGMFCYLQAISYIGVGYAAPISSLYPVFGALLSFLFLKERMTKWGIIGFSIAIFCTLLLSLDLSSSQILLFGVGLAFISALSWGAEIVLSSYVMQFLPSTVVYFFRQLGASLGYLFLLFFFELDTATLFKSFTESHFVFLLCLIFASSMLSYLLYYQAIYLIKPIRAMMLNITYGFWIVLLSVILGRTEMNISIVLLTIGVVVGTTITLKDKREKL
ncbi:DMT family transporter [Pasteurella atlantica]|uniref:DMT family transporter n=2 Tax=Pasteurellaceae TaxID=712 RepID=A0ACC6HN02_9PAST|nr:DMT family transporter [Pasteurella atlantica]MDP8052198.1 DMT family transporter [Pasteurella atlantica]MDP8101200.1 DMT family transporter [Pasteurella atlantica]MDP8105089.1 DMT family transporter [Pasteurella atlantica]MDP8148574.1 DMT family transporter [Pasteurella atlantica]